MKKPEIQKEYGLYINGEWRPASDKGTFETTCPANGEKLALCAEATKEDVDAAVKAARAAWKEWSKTSPAERAQILWRIADIIDENKEHLAMVEVMDNGKPIRETLGADVPESADHFRYFAGVIRAEEGSANMLNEKTLSLILRDPIGVVARLFPGISLSSWAPGNWLRRWPPVAPSCSSRPAILRFPLLNWFA